MKAGKHVVLCAATTGYQVRAFDEAARRLGVRLTLGPAGFTGGLRG